MDKLGWAAGKLAAKLKAFSSIDIRITDGEETISVKATLGKSEYASTNADMITTTFQSRDYMVTAADLVFSGKQRFPQVGWMIEEVISGIKCEVLPEPGMNDYRKSDPQGNLLRIHTKQIS